MVRSSTLALHDCGGEQSRIQRQHCSREICRVYYARKGMAPTLHLQITHAVRVWSKVKGQLLDCSLCHCVKCNSLC